MTQPTKQLLCEVDKPLRPSDWSQRLAMLGSSFGRDRRLRYSPYLKPVVRDSKRCLCLHSAMQQLAPALHRSVLDFAAQHRLQQVEL